jgi:hypothetical protein
LSIGSGSGSRDDLGLIVIFGIIVFIATADCPSAFGDRQPVGRSTGWGFGRGGGGSDERGVVTLEGIEFGRESSDHDKT